MSNLLKFDRTRLRRELPTIQVAYKTLKFENNLKRAIDFIEGLPPGAAPDLIGLKIEIQKELINHGVLDLDLEIVEDNFYGFDNCDYCGQIGDKLDRDECCDEALAGGFEE